jgi:hypothetical protein
MHRVSEQYRFARVDGLIIMLARLKEQFEDRAVNSKKWGSHHRATCERESLRALAHIGNRTRGLLRRHAAGRNSISFRSIGRRCGISD